MVCREFDDVISAGKLFHVRATVKGNVWSPTVDSCTSTRTINRLQANGIDNKYEQKLAQQLMTHCI